MLLVNRITSMQHRFGYLRGRPLRERMKIISTRQPWNPANHCHFLFSLFPGAA